MTERERMYLEAVRDSEYNDTPYVDVQVWACLLAAAAEASAGAAPATRYEAEANGVVMGFDTPAEMKRWVETALEPHHGPGGRVHFTPDGAAAYRADGTVAARAAMRRRA